MLQTPPTKVKEFARRISRSTRPYWLFKNATVKVVKPPYAIAHATAIRISAKNGGNRSISNQGTGVLERECSGAIAVSGMRLRNARLVAPMMPLKAKSAAKWCDCGLVPRVNAASNITRQLPKFTATASRKRYFPRRSSGTNAVIQGSHAALEIPRERLN